MLRARLRRESGQTAAEYLGVLAVIGLIIAVLAASDVGTRVLVSTRGAICTIAGGSDCGTADQVAGGPQDGPAPVQPAGGPAGPAAGEQPQDGGGGGDEAGDDGGGGWWDRTKQLGGSFVDGLIRGDFNREGADDGWSEGFRNAGQFVSGVLVVGDVRDAGAALQRLWQTGGSDGWGDLLWSGAGLIPIGGDIAKGVRGGARTVDVVRAADDVPRVRPDVPGAPRYSNRTGGEDLGANAPRGFRSDGTMPRDGERPVYDQGKAPTCGPVACGMALDTMGRPVDLSDLVKLAGPKGTPINVMTDAMRRGGVNARQVNRMTVDDLEAATRQGNPAIAIIRTNSNARPDEVLHAVVIDGVTTRNGQRVVAVRNPWGEQYFQTVDSFLSQFTGQGIVVDPP